MVSSSTKKIFSLAISLLVVVISLTGVALGATAPTGLSKLARYTPGFSGSPGKMARDAAGNFYVTDFWGKGIMKLDRNGVKSGFISTKGRPTAVAVLRDSRLVVAVATPQPYIAFYSQVSGAETRFVAPAQPLFRPVAITVDAAGNIYVLDSGDSTGVQNGACTSYTDPGTAYTGKVRVYNATGTTELLSFGSRTATNCTSTVGGEFKQPMGIAFEKVGDPTLAPNGYIVVADTHNCRLQFFSAYSGGACNYVKSVGVSNGSNESSGYGNTGALKLGNAVDATFEYTSGGALNRIYVAERGRNEIVTVDPVTALTIGRLSGTTVTNASMKLPSAVLFEKTATGGVLYTDNAATSTEADILAIAIDLGTIPVPTIILNITSLIPETVTSSSLTVSGTVSPASAVSCSVNGGTDVSAGSSSNWSTVTPLALQTGYNYILCKSTNGSGVTTFKEAITYYNGTPPQASPAIIVLPAAGTVTKDASVVVSGTATEGATVKIGNANASFTANVKADGDGNWSASVALAEGSNVISVTASTPGSTDSNSVTRTVIADYTAPNMATNGGAISFLANSATTVNAVQNIDGIVVDANLSSIEVNGVAVPEYAKVALSATSKYFSVPVTLVRGSNTVTVKATDSVGYSSTVARTVTLNPDLPGFTVVLPGDNAYRDSAGTTAANGTADASYTSVTAGDKTVTPSGGNWSTPDMTVTGGFVTYPFTASGSGPTVSEKRTINAAGGYAQLAITTPAADIATKESSVPFAGKVAIGAPTPTISVDGISGTLSYDAGTGDFSATVTLSTPGPHVVAVTVGSTTAVRNIIYDTTLPELSLQASSNASPRTVKGSIEPSARISSIVAKLNDVEFSIPLSVLTYSPYAPATGFVEWNANLSAYAFDKESLKITATDPASNQKTLTFKNGVPTGDIDDDGAVRLADALACLRHVAGTQVLTGDALFQADVGLLVEDHAAQDGSVDITDAVLILSKSYGLVSF